MGVPAALAGSAVRFSLGHETTEPEIDRAGDIIARIMNRISSASAGRRPELQGAAI
jgi:cysteine sulfinate desulfinase/cysteine desulfurase-like protein